MAHWKWDSTFSVGISTIDEQHKRIIDYINDLYFAGMHRDFERIQSVLLGLLDYTVSHFSFEEHLMEEAGYHRIAAHKEIHNAFINRIHYFKERFERPENIGKELGMELQIWLIHHIQHEDADYKEMVQAMLRKQQLSAEEKQSEEGFLAILVDKFFK